MVNYTELSTGHGIQRNRGCLPGRSASSGSPVLLLLYPAYHRRRTVCEHEFLFVTDLRRDLFRDHLPVRICTVHQTDHQTLPETA